MKNMTTKFLLVSAVSAAAVCAQAQQRVVAPAGQAYTIQSIVPASGNATYKWFRDGAVIANETGESYTVPANLAKHPNGLSARQTSGATFHRVAQSADCLGGAAASNEVIVYFCELIVNGVCWARANSDNYSRICPNPWDLGYMYAWNKLEKAWASTGTLSDWSTASPNYSATWTNGTPCPAGWRLPTVQDFRNLSTTSQTAGGTWIDGQARGFPAGVAGRLFGYNTLLCTTSDMTGCVFLPVAGYRENTTSVTSSTSALYWSGEQNSLATGNYFSFSSSSTIVEVAQKWAAMSIRCVQDVAAQ